MPKTKVRQIPSPAKAKQSSELIVRVDGRSKRLLARAAKLRRMSIEAYMISVAVAEARRGIRAPGDHFFRMSPAAQLAFWKMLHEPVKLTVKQKELGAMMRGEA